MKMRYDNESMRMGKRALIRIAQIALNFCVFYGILKLIVLASDRFMCMPIYYVGMTLFAAALGVLFVCYYVLNGFSFDNSERTADDLPDEWDDAKKKEYLKQLSENRKKAKKLIYYIMPMILTIAVYYIEINFFK